MNVVETLLASASNEGCSDDLTVVSREALEALRDMTPVSFLELALKGLEKDLNKLSVANQEKLQQAILAVERALDYLGIREDSDDDT